MKLSEIIEVLGYVPVFGDWEDREVFGAFTSDLLSDVMAGADEKQVLITVQAHKNTIAVAVLKDMAAVFICSGRPVPNDMTDAARNENVPLFTTADNQYTASWRFRQVFSSAPHPGHD